MEDLDTNRHAPEIASQERDIEEGGAGHTEQDRRKRVEERKYKRVPSKIAADFAVPGRGAESLAIEDAGLRAVDQHAPEGQLADDFVQGALADEPFFKDVAETVAGGSDEGEEITLDGIESCELVCAGDVVGTEDYAYAADAEEDSEDLSPVVAYFEDEEAHDYDDGDGPEFNELGRENCRLLRIC